MSETRYNRQMLVEGLGEAGQRRLASVRVGIVGLGALGCAIADQIARGGFGYLRLIDPDTPEISNLQRQVLIDEDDVKAGRPKALAAATKLRRANSEIIVEEHVARLSPENASDLLSGLDLVLDGTDNFPARYLINETCVRAGTPWIYGGVIGASGMSFPVLPGGPCLYCTFGSEPPMEEVVTTAEAGVLCSIVATIASLEVVRAIKLLTGTPVQPNLTSIDLWAETMLSEPVEKDANCPICGGH